jgi:hypothetical protein
MKRALAVLVPVLALALGQIAAAKAPAAQADPIAKAKALFRRYVEMEHAFDPAIVALYSDTAVILNRRVLQNGQVVPLTIPASRYKQVVRDGMPKAREQGYVSTYSGDTYTREGDRVRINVIRYFAPKRYSSPMSLLVGPDARGRWIIFEQQSESHVSQ